MATLKQKTAFKKVLENMETANPKTAGQILAESGYSQSVVKKPSHIIDSKGFQGLLAQIDDRVILGRFREILTSSDKRASLSAGIELLKLKDRYPDQKTKVTGLFGILDGLRDDSRA